MVSSVRWDKDDTLWVSCCKREQGVLVLPTRQVRLENGIDPAVYFARKSVMFCG
jgi:hypothetical protein